MKRSDLNFDYPESLVALRRETSSRVMWVQDGSPSEWTLSQLLEAFAPGDVLVINDTKVLRRRIFAQDRKGNEVEVLFLEALDPRTWKVLFPLSRLKDLHLSLPGGIETREIRAGKPQTLLLSADVDEEYFEKYGELPLPPYIQKARGQRHNLAGDKVWYQTDWAARPGSQAAPTASLHFKNEDLLTLERRGISVVHLTLHVGMGTFLPIDKEDLSQHLMHAEWVHVSAATWKQIQKAKTSGHRVWALGTTVFRSLESVAQGRLKGDPDTGFEGFTDIFIRPPFRPQVVDRLLTNFHQPQSTLLALVAAFAGLENVLSCYHWAISKNFRLFSYGDLTVWSPSVDSSGPTAPNG